MIAYGLAKASVHQLVKSLASEGSGLPAGARANAILPITLDTPANRKFAAADTDFSTWTPMDVIAEQFLAWASKKQSPTTGTLYKVATEKGKTDFRPVD
ncbi:hypothetical protein HK104_002079 [Borealophlyctis nickersoniae]|nr:hypothetical protein HK104_002079 [Borealophlyctis nickersoniae]